MICMSVYEKEEAEAFSGFLHRFRPTSTSVVTEHTLGGQPLWKVEALGFEDRELVFLSAAFDSGWRAKSNRGGKT